jgi:carboxymethylenebutenolidase
LVPDLYRGKVGAEAEEAHHLMSNLDWPSAVEDIRGAARFLKAEGSPKVGVIGFCMGGALALAAAVHVEELDAAVPFYGVPNPQLADTKKTRVPVQGHFGGQDPMKGFSDAMAAADLDEALAVAGVTHEVFI